MLRKCVLFVGLLTLLLFWVSLSPAATEKAKPDFDREIAPLLARHCLECHSGAAPKGDLDLSKRKTAEGALAPGKIDESAVWEQIESDQMPKDRDPLSDSEKNLLKDWIESGAHWSKEEIDPLAYSTTNRAGYDWWSLKPVSDPSPPKVQKVDWCRNEIDHFILSRLEQSGLKPAAEAERNDLIRRLTFGLTGLPPTPEEVEKFQADEDPRAYEKLVDKLLASPHYGEHWARHWLDVVRFGESQGFERNKIRDSAWLYRDWVISSLNNDLPYDEFVRQQIAGDILYPNQLDPMIATGYHVCGTWDQVAHVEGSESMRKAARWDHLEDLVGTLGQAFLGLSIHCGRCHDHKFDPISQQDYYQITSLLAGVHQREQERTDIKASRNSIREQELRSELAALHEKRSMLQKQVREKYSRPEDAVSDTGLEVLWRIPSQPKEPVLEESQKLLSLVPSSVPLATENPPTELIQKIKSKGAFSVEVWVTPGKVNQKGPARIVTISENASNRNLTIGQEGNLFDVRLRTSKTNENGLPSTSAKESQVQLKKTHLVFTFEKGETRLYQDGKLTGKNEIGGDLSNWDEKFRLGIGDEFSGDRSWKGEVHFLAFYSTPLTDQQIDHHFSTESREVKGVTPWAIIKQRAIPIEQQEYDDLELRIAQSQQELQSITAPPMVHTLFPEQPGEIPILARGDPNQPVGIAHPRGLIALAQAGLSGDFGLQSDSPEGERRKQLALWITDPRNPLTPRVIVNRIWHYHFGQGIVDTPSDFGFLGGRPSHPELLDHLTSEFVRGGWRIKEIHKIILLSATYRQASQVRNEAALQVDRDNRLLWKFSSRRLSGEETRDALLEISGALNRKMGGPSYRDMKLNGGVMGTNAEFTDPTGEFSDAVNRRTIYRLWARSGNLPLLESLDCPDPSVMAPRRNQTITPVQALALLNDVFTERIAEKLEHRLKTEIPGELLKEQIQRLYQLVLLRKPSELEFERALQFAQKRGLSQLAIVLVNSNEFLFIE